MTTQWHHPWHRAMAALLGEFNAAYLERNDIALGGGARLALALGEYRVTHTIDLICLSTAACRAVREAITANSLGALMPSSRALARGVRTERLQIRTAIAGHDAIIPVQILICSDWHGATQQASWCPSPVIDRDTSYAMKLTAAFDRGADWPHTDVVDLMAMRWQWGEPSAAALAEADRHYGPDVLPAAQRTMAAVLNYSADDRERLATELGLSSVFHTHFEQCVGGKAVAL